METEEKVAAIIRYYSVRYALAPDDWLQALIEMESTPIRPTRVVDWSKYTNGPYCCSHCGSRTQYGMGAKRHHNRKHHACNDPHNHFMPEGATV